MSDEELRALDRQVALAIGDQFVPDDPNRPDGSGWWRAQDGTKTSTVDGGPARYSSCWSAMGRLVEMVKARTGLQLILEDGRIGDLYDCWLASLYKGDTYESCSRGPTAPVAVCRAVLDAMEADNGH